ncbi:MAG: type II toxin-antitoxin system prevent-host-death family antitoxin, partial [Deltaproteobacteria bacterium]|nr:type II toxin-antitoxin system prevent-host-death family antitoxin [Deltaproteobacteria bacterium]
MESTVGAGEFKNRCLKILDEVRATGLAVTITKRGRPVARLVPATPIEPDV